MNSATEMARRLVQELEKQGKLDDPQEVFVEILHLLRIQDQRTRHACAEAVITIDSCRTSNENAIYNSVGDIVDKAVCVDQAHNACMNVKAV